MRRWAKLQRKRARRPIWALVFAGLAAVGLTAGSVSLWNPVAGFMVGVLSCAGWAMTLLWFTERDEACSYPPVLAGYEFGLTAIASHPKAQHLKQKNRIFRTADIPAWLPTGLAVQGCLDTWQDARIVVLRVERGLALCKILYRDGCAPPSADGLLPDGAVFLLGRAKVIGLYQVVEAQAGLRQAIRSMDRATDNFRAAAQVAADLDSPAFRQLSAVLDGPAPVTDSVSESDRVLAD